MCFNIYVNLKNTPVGPCWPSWPACQKHYFLSPGNLTMCFSQTLLCLQETGPGELTSPFTYSQMSKAFSNWKNSRVMDDLLTVSVFCYSVSVVCIPHLIIFIFHCTAVYILMLLSSFNYLQLHLYLSIGFATAFSFLETLTLETSWISWINCPAVVNTYSDYIWLCDRCCSQHL